MRPRVAASASWPSIIRLPSRRSASHIVPVRRATIYVAGAALLAGVTAAVLTATREHEELRAVGHPAVWAFVLLIGWSFIGSGIVAAARGLAPASAHSLSAPPSPGSPRHFPHREEPVLFTIGTLLASLWIAIFVHALLAFPGGRLESRAARIVVAAYYFQAVALQLGWPCSPTPRRLTAVMRRGADHVLAPRRVGEQPGQPLWVSVSRIACEPAAGYVRPCHRRSPASRGEVSVPTIEVGHHCFAATA